MAVAEEEPQNEASACVPPEDDGSESDRDEEAEDALTDPIRPGRSEESGYDTDPVERFFVISKWQRQLRRIQRGSSEMLRREDGSGPLRNLRERRRQVVSKVIEQRDQMVGRVKDKREQAFTLVKDKREQVVDKVKKIANLRERQQKFRQSVEDFKGRTEKVVARMRMAKVRQFRHMMCFTCTITNLSIASFWLGRFPQTFHWWYTANCVWLVGCRAIWYRWHLWHYYLLDLCYWVNAAMLVYLWILPGNEWFFSGVYGFSGILLISVPVFRNSLIPHSLDHITSFQIHVTPVVQLWVLRWESPTWPNSGFRIPKEMSVVPGFTLYIIWALIYYLYMFVVAQKKIERRGYETLYKHMAVNMGLKKKLPKNMQQESKAKAIFITGHFILFIAGIGFVHFPYWLHTAALCIGIVWGIRNGATFYMTYFWKVYESQIHAFERQMAQAQEDAAEPPQSPTGSPQLQHANKVDLQASAEFFAGTLPDEEDNVSPR